MERPTICVRQFESQVERIPELVARGEGARTGGDEAQTVGQCSDLRRLEFSHKRGRLVIASGTHGGLYEVEHHPEPLR